MKKPFIKTALLSFAAATAVLLSGCAGSKGAILTPLPGAEPTDSISAVKAKCANEAANVMPKSLSFLETIPPSTYALVYTTYAACNAEHGYETQCDAHSKWFCGHMILN